jgi:hypothetical protein
MKTFIVDSTTLRRVGYDAEHQLLQIEFQNLSIYQYFDAFVQDSIMPWRKHLSYLSCLWGKAPQGTATRNAGPSAQIPPETAGDIKSRSPMRASFRASIDSGPKGLSQYRPVFLPASRSLILREVSEARGRGPDPHWASATCLEKAKLPAERVLHIDHLFARMQRLNTYEAKTNAMTRIGSNLSQVLRPPFSCE